MNKVPEFLFVGTAKAGTTSIYRFLKEHPSVCIPQKETFHFLANRFAKNTLRYPFQREKKSIVFDLKKYTDIYKSCENKIIGEIGTGYLYHHQDAIPEILKVLGDKVKIFIVLRNPIERAFSSYMHFIKDTREKLSFQDALNEEEKRIFAGWDFMWHYKAMGQYSEQVKAYKKNFNDVEILFYEDLNAEPEKFMHELLNKLNLEVIISKNVEVYNPSGIPKRKWLQNLLMRENIVKKSLRGFYYSLFGKEKVQALREQIKNKNLERGQIKPEERKYLIDFYKQDIIELEKVIGVKTNWI